MVMHPFAKIILHLRGESFALPIGLCYELGPCRVGWVGLIGCLDKRCSWQSECIAFLVHCGSAALVDLSPAALAMQKRLFCATVGGEAVLWRFAVCVRVVLVADLDGTPYRI